MSSDDAASRKSALRRSLRAERRRRLADAGATLPVDVALPLTFTEPVLRLARAGQASRVRAGASSGISAADARPDASRDPEARPGAPRIAAFCPTPTEPDPMPLVVELIAAGAEVIFPVDGGEELDWVRWDGRTAFVPSPGRGFGSEPAGERLGADALEHADLVLAPALAVDRSGVRLGHGRGLYDRALAHADPAAPVIAVVHPWEVLPAGDLPAEPHDRPVDAVLTGEGLVRLGAAS